ncbi:uncharacterized protein LOC115634758 [Scaptodrosophila lebanonensis]|uniref:Uncharacterized protein LOC115634758 n=1 Tax=Drosophila lebanonensis TaxID=7225 RepID=A0A6J2UJW1_DROLE|nr:uncharacterized protein LOC115634758 [Scaptodrosophila lebanonensis]
MDRLLFSKYKTFTQSISPFPSGRLLSKNITYAPQYITIATEFNENHLEEENDDEGIDFRFDPPDDEGNSFGELPRHWDDGFFENDPACLEVVRVVSFYCYFPKDSLGNGISIQFKNVGITYAPGD